MNRAPLQYFDTRTGHLLPRPQVPQGNPLGPPPMRSRGRGFRGFGGTPAPGGGPGPLIDPYTETTAWNTDNGTVGAPPLLQQGTTTGAPMPGSTVAPTRSFRSPSAPFGESDRPWINPTTFATVPINTATNIQVPVLSLNFARNFLLIQNNSTATTPDTAPFLYVGFNAQPQVGYSLQLQPGQGVFFDLICPRDSIYVAFGPFVDTGLSTVVAGCVIQGTYVPNQSQAVLSAGGMMAPTNTHGPTYNQ
jgi:hypothetical protein